MCYKISIYFKNFFIVSSFHIFLSQFNIQEAAKASEIFWRKKLIYKKNQHQQKSWANWAQTDLLYKFPLLNNFTSVRKGNQAMFLDINSAPTQQ
jgi:hypothetical protein